MSTIKVFTAEEALAAVKEQGDKVLSVIKKKDTKPGKAGSFFLNVKFHGIAGVPKADGWFSVKDWPIAAVQDPAKKRAGSEETKPQISVKISQAGAFGQFMMALQPIWRAKIQELIDSKQIVLGRRLVHDLVQLTISEKAEENAGQPLDDPILRVKMADREEKFPATYPVAILQNKPKTEVMDFRTGVETDGITTYKPATIIDESGREVPVSFANMHKFITPGSYLRRGRISITSVAVSEYWISVQITINKAVIEPGGAGGFDDGFDAPAAKPTAPVTAVATAVAPVATAVANAPAVVPNVTAPVTAVATAAAPATSSLADADDIADVINGL